MRVGWVKFVKNAGGEKLQVDFLVTVQVALKKQGKRASNGTDSYKN